MNNIKAIEQLEKLNDYIVGNLNMELMDTELGDVRSVKNQIESWENNRKEWDTDYTYVVEELKKYEDYNCLYCIDHEMGGCFGQGYVIVDENLNYKGFVRTI